MFMIILILDTLYHESELWAGCVLCKLCNSVYVGLVKDSATMYLYTNTELNILNTGCSFVHLDLETEI